MCPPENTIVCWIRGTPSRCGTRWRRASDVLDRFCDKENVVIPEPRPLKALKLTNAVGRGRRARAARPCAAWFRIGDVLEQSSLPVAHDRQGVCGMVVQAPRPVQVDGRPVHGLHHDARDHRATRGREAAARAGAAEAKAAVPPPGPPPPPEHSHVPTIKVAISGMGLVRRGSVTVKCRRTTQTSPSWLDVARAMPTTWRWTRTCLRGCKPWRHSSRSARVAPSGPGWRAACAPDARCLRSCRSTTRRPVKPDPAYLDREGQVDSGYARARHG